MDANKFLNYNLPDNLSEKEREEIEQKRIMLLRNIQSGKNIASDLSKPEDFEDLFSYLANEAERNENTAYVARSLYLVREKIPTDEDNMINRQKVLELAVEDYSLSLNQQDIRSSIEDIFSKSDDTTFRSVLDQNPEMKDNFVKNLIVFQDKKEEELQKTLETERKKLEEHNKRVYEAKNNSSKLNIVGGFGKKQKNIDEELKKIEKEFREKNHLKKVSKYIEDSNILPESFRKRPEYKDKSKEYDDALNSDFNPQAKIRDAIRHGGESQFFSKEQEYYSYLYDQKLKECKDKYGIEKKHVIFGKFRKEDLLEADEQGVNHVLMTSKRKQVTFNKFPQEDDKYTLMALKAKVAGIKKPEIFVSRNWKDEQKEMFIMKTLQALTEHGNYDLDSIKVPKKFEGLKQKFAENKITSGLKETTEDTPENKEQELETPNNQQEEMKEELEQKTKNAGDSPEGSLGSEFESTAVEQNVSQENNVPEKNNSISSLTDVKDMFMTQSIQSNAEIPKVQYAVEKMKVFTNLLANELGNQGVEKEKIDSLMNHHKVEKISPSTINNGPAVFEEDLSKILDKDTSIPDLIKRTLDKMPNDEEIQGLKHPKNNDDSDPKNKNSQSLKPS